MLKKTDIIIPVHNRWDHTKQTLDSLFANTRHEAFHLYVIDDLSSEENRQKLLKYRSDNRELFNLTLNSKNIGPGASRNLVTNHIKDISMQSHYIYHSDNDVYFTPGWLEKLLVIYEEFKETIPLLGGGCHPYLQNKAVVDSKDVVGYRVGIKDAVSGYSQLMTWEVWNKYGPFDESMRDAEKKIMGSEDWAFCQKIVKDGFNVGSVEPELVIATGKTNTYGDPATGHETFRQVEGVKVI